LLMATLISAAAAFFPAIFLGTSYQGFPRYYRMAVQIFWRLQVKWSRMFVKNKSDGVTVTWSSLGVYNHKEEN